jgi:hypothetical protein
MGGIHTHGAQVMNDAPEESENNETGGEGTHARETLEARNEQRASGITVVVHSGGEVTVHQGTLPLLVNEHYEELRTLSKRAIILGAIVVLGLAIWRLGFIARVAEAL